MILWNTSKEDDSLILHIADRAIALGIRVPRLTLMMDLTGCHLNGCPLDLPKLLIASDAELAHDVWGIHQHISVETGKIDASVFHPRFAKKNHSGA